MHGIKVIVRHAQRAPLRSLMGAAAVIAMTRIEATPSRAGLNHSDRRVQESTTLHSSCDPRNTTHEIDIENVLIVLRQKKNAEESLRKKQHNKIRKLTYSVNNMQV